MMTAVGIILAIGLMVFFIQLGEAISKSASQKVHRTSEKELDELREQLEALRAELTSLREILGEHAISVDRNLDMLNSRVQRLEETRSSNELRQRLGTDEPT